MCWRFLLSTLVPQHLPKTRSDYFWPPGGLRNRSTFAAYLSVTASVEAFRTSSCKICKPHNHFSASSFESAAKLNARWGSNTNKRSCLHALDSSQDLKSSSKTFLLRFQPLKEGISKVLKFWQRPTSNAPLVPVELHMYFISPSGYFTYPFEFIHTTDTTIKSATFLGVKS